jgi:hypothetical protein
MQIHKIHEKQTNQRAVSTNSMGWIAVTSARTLNSGKKANREMLSTYKILWWYKKFQNDYYRIPKPFFYSFSAPFPQLHAMNIFCRLIF